MGTMTYKACLIVLVLLLGGCVASAPTVPGTPAVPTPPQVTVVQYANLATAAGDTAARVLVALCTPTPPALDLVTCNKVKTDLMTVKSAVDQIVAEANKVPTIETWAVARVNIAAITATAAANAATGNTALDSDITSLLSLVKQIAAVQ
jgi:hypothetical protein